MATIATAGIVVASCSSADMSTGPLQPTGHTATVVITPASTSLVVGATLPLQAQARDAGGNVVPDATIHWSSSDTAVAEVSSAGMVTARRVGTVQIAASAEGHSAIATLSVTSVPVSSVAVAPTSGTLLVGATMTLTAITYDGSGNVLAGRGIVWASSAPQTADVSSTGMVTAKSPGTATITATSEGKTAAAQITVNAPPPAPVTSVSVTPATSQVAIRASETLSAVTRDAGGNTLTGRTVTWSSSDARVATVTPSGTVTGVAAGTVTITATSEGHSGTATVTVPAPAAPPPPAAVLDTLIVTSSATLPVMNTNSTVTLTARAVDTNGNTMTTPPLTWTAGPGNLGSIISTSGSSAVLKSKGHAGWVMVRVSSGSVHTDFAIFVLSSSD